MSKKKVSFQALIDKSQKEAIPSIDIVSEVSHRIAKTGTKTPEVELSLLGAVGLSVTASALMVFTLYKQQDEMDTALADWLQPLMVVMK